MANDLLAEFPGRNGFSAQNLWLMCQFFKEYTDKPKLQSLVGEISWAKNLLIMARCKGEPEATIRKFRIVQTEANQQYDQFAEKYRNGKNANPEKRGK